MKIKPLNKSYLALSLALAVTVLSFVLPEWYYPSLPLSDGKTFSAYGFPLPYLHEGGTSLLWLSMPHVFILNVLLITATAYGLLVIVLPRTWRNWVWLKWASYLLCSLVISTYLFSTVLQLNSGFLKFTTNMALNISDNTGYFDLRPFNSLFFNELKPQIKAQQNH